MSHKHIVVVGGTKGLGKIIVERYLEKDFFVTTLSRNKIESESKNLNCIITDLEKLNSPEKIVENTIKFGKNINYLVFCQRYRGTEDSWTGEIQVSLNATRTLINAYADYFDKYSDKSICVVSSVYAEFIGGSQPDSYHVIKAALNQLVKYNAVRLGEKGIRINSIMPLTYLKPESKNFYLNNIPLMDLYKNFVPLKRIGKVEDSANLIEFLCSNKSSFITGQSIFVDGGVSIVWPEELARTMSEL